MTRRGLQGASYCCFRRVHWNRIVVNLCGQELFSTSSAPMPDKYKNFEQLAAVERAGRDYRIVEAGDSADVVVIAPHGGNIEPGTSQTAGEIAGADFGLYCFEGVASGRPHRDLHITSTLFDEPRGVARVKVSKLVVAVHGRVNEDDDDQCVWLGGLDLRLREAIAVALIQSGFEVKQNGHTYPATNPMNICNRGKRSMGVQLDLPRTLRDRLTRDDGLRASFGSAVREGIERTLKLLAKREER